MEHVPRIRAGADVTHVLAVDSPKAAPARAFGRELMRAIEKRGIPRNELWRTTKIGRTALDHYRVGAVLPRTESAAALAAVLEWPRLLEIVAQARTKPCQRCGRPFTNDGGNQGAKRYCTVSCRDLAAEERLASSRIRSGGQTGDARQTRAAIQRLRSGIRIAEERSRELVDAIDAMCRSCEPQGVCRTADCPLRSFSPLPFRIHGSGDARTRQEIEEATTQKRWTPAARAAHGEVTRQMHAEGRIPYFAPGDPRHPANDPERREGWIQRQREGHRNRPRRPLTPEHRQAIAAGHARRRTLEATA